MKHLISYNESIKSRKKKKIKIITNKLYIILSKLLYSDNLDYEMIKSWGGVYKITIDNEEMFLDYDDSYRHEFIFQRKIKGTDFTNEPFGDEWPIEEEEFGRIKVKLSLDINISRILKLLYKKKYDNLEEEEDDEFNIELNRLDDLIDEL